MEATIFMAVDNSTVEEADVDDKKNHEALDDILNDDEDVNDAKGVEEKDAENFNKKIGTQEFTSEVEYDKAVSNMQERNSTMATTLGKHGIDPKTGEKKEVEKKEEKIEQKEEEKDKPTEEQQFLRFKALDFQENFPDSKNYKDEMKVFIKNKRANIDGKPSFALAYAKALKADEQDIPDNLIKIIRKQKGEDVNVARSATKKVMQSGGNRARTVGREQDTYKDQKSLDEMSSFGDNIALGRD